MQQITLQSGAPIAQLAQGQARPNGSTHFMLWVIDTVLHTVFIKKTAREEQVYEDGAWRQGMSRNVAIRAHKTTACSS